MLPVPKYIRNTVEDSKLGKDRDINMTVAYITPPVPALFVHTSNQERQIQLAFPL